MDGRFHRARMHRTVGANLVLTLLCVLPFITFVLAQVPYTPSNLLYSSQQNGSFAYLLRPADTNQHRTAFLSLDVSEKVDTDNPSFTVLFDEAPFHNGHDTYAYIPAIDQAGVVKVYAGDCWNPGNSPMLWSFKSQSGSLRGNGTWERFHLHGPEGQSSSFTSGPNYLSAGFAYSASNTTESSLFAFAGMCPYQSDGSSWITTAEYSQTMTVLNPIENQDSYRGSNIGDRAPPIPEAGFSITPLPATYASSDDEIRQQQDFLLIGGHTQQAFINMSELAIFSAPQNSWSFVSVGAVVDRSRNDLAFRDSAVIEPRSGHTAVLSPDGSKIVVFGGWVGNTSVPASPQLAILDIGEGLIGSGDWAWRIPSTSGVPKGSGIYGHGATMLPGGVMMIAGGYELSQLSKRSEAQPQHNSHIYLYDVSSNSWASSYENPYFKPSAEAADTSPSESSSFFSQKAGLGVGIGLGVPAAAGIGLFILYYCRRHKKRQSRDKEIRKLALGAQRAHFWGRDSEMASSIRNPSLRASIVNIDYPWIHNNKTQSTGKKPNWDDHGDAVAERTGLLGGIHVPKKPNRPTLNAGVYRPPYHDYRRGDTAGGIHPIDEREEDEAHRAERLDTRDTVDSLAFVTARNTQVDGPFAAGGIGKDGRQSPDQGERTSSNLSDSSASAKSAKPAALSRIVFNNASNLPANGNRSPDKPAFVSGHNRDTARSQDSSTSTASFEKRYSSDSYSTAQSTFSQRQAEGEHLLQEGSEQSPSLDIFNSKPPSSMRPRASEWIGGIRRVLSVSRKRPSITEGSSTVSRASGFDGKNSMFGLSAADSKMPRRSVSASAELFKRKQGAKDWGVGNRFSHDTGFLSARSTRDDFGLDGFVDLGNEEDWDVEAAAEGRRVQVTFTVPREKLRVVNATADDISEQSVSRSNSSS
ncbi:hypothetical protein BJX99DRAFT_234853 [Aspergillus californicus]